MHLIPPVEPSGRLLEMPDGPQRLAAELWDGCSTGAARASVLEWIGRAERPVLEAADAMEGIAWAMGLARLAKILDSASWQALADLLYSMAADADAALLDERPLVHQLLAAELAATLAAGLSDKKLRRRLEKSAQVALRLGLSRALDAAGLPGTEHFRQMRPLLACWTRCRALANATGAQWGPRAMQKYDRLLRNIIRLARPDGQSPWTRRPAAPSSDLLKAALAVSENALSRQIAAVALPDRSAKSTARRRKKGPALPPAGFHSEEKSLAVLRRGWESQSERQVVRFAGRDCDVELIANGQVVAFGAWQCNVSRLGQPLEVMGHWESTCWHSDDDVDYLELQLELAGGTIVERHMALAREDRFLLLADVVIAPSGGGLEYCGILPLGDGVSFRAMDETREGLLVHSSGSSPRTALRSRRKIPPKAGTANGRPVAHVLPLALPEWRCDARFGQLLATERGLELRQATEKQRLFAPLLIDLDPTRFRRRVTWRRLTVAESLLPVPEDRAVGYRVAIGKQQWLIYRSLAARGNRTLLGHNLSTQTLMARFLPDGEIEPIVEIE